ncbi:AraC family transcriptional regulator [Chitinophaga silvisoli]|uniref:Helix-turn-helix domain-containing protein n=1 Tax=Chitinophaga silvisoli TaxID=2291814 RepID=A0A3E1NYB1_9BACT|nr:helix-turn-helix transcriptional regulator [Chitinophaga silvisoli]RFM32921.1 helix-turn-helix domain-containing protein [Chitinophaga silvisoli]
MSIIPFKSKINADQQLKVSPFKEVIKPTVPHKHANYYELILLEQGGGFHQIDDQQYDVTPPTAYFLKPGQTHCWNFSRIPTGFVILFREEILSRECLDIVYNLPTNIPLSNSETLFELSRRFNQDFRTPASLAVLNTYLQLILLKINEEIRTPSPGNAVFSPIYYQFKSLVNEHFLKVKQIQAYARMLHLPPAQLTNICKAASGKTPSMLLNERIVLEAKTLLSNTPLSIKEITDALEFSDASNFVKFFKLYTNLTPGQYRELAMAKQQ